MPAHTTFIKTLFLVIFGFAVLFGTSYYFLKDDPAKNVPSEYQMAGENETVIRINDTDLTVEIADEPQEQTQGLSGKTILEENEGMLFVFPTAEIHMFWMKDMNFALDMIWIDNEGIIVDITKNVAPETFPKTFGPTSPVNYVLEVNAGWSDRNNINIGDLMEF